MSASTRPSPEPAGAAASERARRYWDTRAARYDKAMDRMERLLLSDGRDWVCSKAAGEVLEVAVGTGRNFPLYPPGVHLTGLDYSPAMLAVARERARALALQVDLREGDAHALPFADGSFDTVVCALGLCSVHDDRRAVAELVRVLRPGGLLLLLDHVRGANPTVRAVQWLLELGTRRVEEFQLRRPLDHVLAEGLIVERRQRSKLGIVERLAARKPSYGSAPLHRPARTGTSAPPANPAAASLGDEQAAGRAAL